MIIALRYSMVKLWMLRDPSITLTTFGGWWPGGPVPEAIKGLAKGWWS